MLAVELVFQRRSSRKSPAEESIPRLVQIVAAQRSKGLPRAFCRELGGEGEREKIKALIAFYSVSLLSPARLPRAFLDRRAEPPYE
jgi:hypothetical protein